MKKCVECSGILKEMRAKTPDGVGYNYYKCVSCGEEILDMKQLHAVAQTYRKIKQYHARISKWGLSLGIRIPKELAKRYKFRSNEDVALIPEEEGLKIVAA